MLIGIVGPSAVVPETELALGAKKITDAGFTVRIHPQVKKTHLFFAGTDEQRAKAFYDYAVDSKVDALWFARGGYGAMLLLPHLVALAKKNGKPPAKKVLIGSSDATSLMEFVRVKWGWKVLHAPMPATMGFQKLSARDWQDLVAQLHQLGKSEHPLGTLDQPLKFVSRGQLKAKSRPVRGELVGGNLSVMCSLIGTPYAIQAKGKILFLEDVTEAPYRLHRMAQHLLSVGAFKGVKAIVIGSLHDCADQVGSVFAEMPGASSMEKSGDTKVRMKPLRPSLSDAEVLTAVFGVLGKSLEIPVAYGLTVGHGPNGMSPLPLGVTYELDAKGFLSLV
ncbi:MAG: LD-carboxypeptidase [Methylotenera sp.]|nr:LD-carboxypeptidase [Oligoflexia bacterium]